jgi:hypothetical protein
MGARGFGAQGVNERGISMRAYLLIGLALVAAGAAGLALEHVVFDGVREFIDAGSIKVMTRSDRFFPLTTLASVFALSAGLVLLVIGRPRGSRSPAE